jgi:hypothetical protein
MSTGLNERDSRTREHLRWGVPLRVAACTVIRLPKLLAAAPSVTPAERATTFPALRCQKPRNAPSPRP